MKKTKSLFAIMICLSILLGFSSCTESNKPLELKYHTNYGLIYREHSETSFTEKLNDYDVSVETVPKDLQAEITSLNKDLLNFINSQYNLNWKYKEVTAYFADFSEIGYDIYAAMADPIAGKFYFNTNLSGSDYKYRAVHELIHCIRYNNIGTYTFALKQEDGILGYFIGESLTDLLTSKYFESLGDPNAYKYFLNTSQYCCTTVATKIIEYSIPKICYYYLINDIDSLSKEFNSIATASINLEADYFEQFANYSDIYMISVSEYIQTGNPEAFQTMSSSMLANFELVVAASRNLEDTSSIIGEIELLFKLENGDGQEFLDYLQNLL